MNGYIGMPIHDKKQAQSSKRHKKGKGDLITYKVVLDKGAYSTSLLEQEAETKKGLPPIYIPRVRIGTSQFHLQ